MRRKTRVYVSGPYSSAPETGTRNAIIAGNALMDAGYAVFVPHLSHYMEAVKHRPWENWIDHDLEWVAACDCVLRLPGESNGAEIECDKARRLGLPVFDSLESLKAIMPTARNE